MLRRTFVHVPGIGKTTEQALWRQGCRDWSCYLDAGNRFSTGRADRGEVRDFLRQSEAALEHREHQFFASRLGLKDSWRAYPNFRESCVFLDIETDGSSITMIGMYSAGNFTCLTKGENLENFRDEISRYAMVVTYNGGSFDLPALKRSFKGVDLDQIHVDLCPLLRKLGYRGGLKKIEKELGIERPEEVANLTGFDAVVLWRRFYGLNDYNALDRLTAYNREDCVNLERLADLAYERLCKATFPEEERVLF